MSGNTIIIVLWLIFITGNQFMLEKNQNIILEEGVYCRVE